jgi:hypothetical protein
VKVPPTDFPQPIAYPRLNFLENVLTSRVMDPVKALGRAGALGGFVNKFDGGVELLDDLDDHWTAKHHKDERNWFIQELQELAADMSVRITILSGDVHLGAVGQFFSNKALGLPKDQDHRYMPNVISSAIVNTPPADFVADVLNKRNKTHHLDEDTDENMMPMFPEDVNNKSRNNKHLLPRRNWCSIREYRPELTPPPSRSPSPSASRSGSLNQKPGLIRTLSLGRRSSLPGAGLVRRLSQRGEKHPPVSYPQRMNNPEYYERRQSYDGQRRASADVTRGAGQAQTASEGELTRARPNLFMRRPTVMLPNNPTHMINLRGGLDIRLNCENERGDPAGTTTEYRLIVPALDYRGDGDPNPEAVKPKGRLSKWFGGGKRGRADYSQESFTSQPGPHSRPPPNDSYDSFQQEHIAVPVPQQHRRRDSLSPPNNATLGPNGLPLRQQKRRPVANTSAPVPASMTAAPQPAASTTVRRQDLPSVPQPAASATMRRQDLPSAPQPAASATMRRQDLSSAPPPEQQRADQRMQPPPVTQQPDTYAGPNTVIPANLPGPPPGPPPMSAKAAALTGVSQTRASQAQRVVSEPRYAAQPQGQRGTGERRRASVDVRRGADGGYV